MNTYKQVNIMIGLLFVGMVGTFFYWIWDNGYDLPGIHVDGREAIARDRQEEEQVDRGAFIYARNCRSCHGLTGTGALERTGLPGAALNNAANRPPELAASEIAPKQQRFTNTIHCGRNGTVMPPWSTEEGGSLNDFQILQLVTLITSRFAEEGWEHAVEYANEADEFSPRKHLDEAIGEDETEIVLNDVSNLTVDSFLRLGGDTIDEPYEVLDVDEVDAATRTLTVVRAAFGTEALEHEAGIDIYTGPIASSETLTGVDTSPTCGQNKPSVGGGGDEVTLADGDTIDMQDNIFVFDGNENPTFTVPAGASLTLTNSGDAIHNLRIDGPDGEYQSDDDDVSDPDAIVGGEEGTIDLDLDPGTYLYQCDFHPALMLGEIVIE